MSGALDSCNPYAISRYKLENSCINIAVTKLAPYGLTEKYLRENVHKFEGVFTHYRTLVYLVTGEDCKDCDLDKLPPLEPKDLLTCAQAIEETNYLHYH